ncbi:glutamine amidotransferase [Neiella marina]|uniref:Glutamine amidotransferase n=1 Tax=Neiella marina TaxID=508461 RepID=A0A8J2U501_9GAMM|nr:DJ-1/PfpI family protein [Neiella marina]GGA76576.1 glutamine amidotransferase [Neiella marina]
MKVAIYLYEQAEVMDFAGPFEVFSTASRMLSQLRTEQALEVFLVSERVEPIAARNGFLVTPHHDFASAPDIDVLIVPGGVHQYQMKQQSTLQWIQQVAPNCRIIASVCTGAFLLAAAGLLDKLTVTTHWQDCSDLQQQFPALKVVDGPRWVEQGNIITSAGIAAGIDMSFHLLTRLVNPSLAQVTAKQMDYPWAADDGSD